MSQPIDIYIPCYQPDEYLERCIQSILKHTKRDYNLTVIAGKRSISKNRNQGLRKGVSEWICSLDADCEVTQDDWIDRLLETAESQPDVGIVGAKIVMFDGKIFSTGTGPNWRPYLYGVEDRGQREFVEEVAGVSANCLLYRRGLLQYDERFIGGDGLEDSDFCMRLRRRGFRVMYDGRVKVIHKKYPKEKTPIFWNHLYFHLKHPTTIVTQYRKARGVG